MDTTAIQQAITTYGYLALFLGTFLEGEVFFILGGVAARQGLLDPFYMALAAMVGAFLRDNLFFFIGYFGGGACWPGLSAWRAEWWWPAIWCGATPWP